MAECTHRDEEAMHTVYEDARLGMSHGSQHCLQKAEGPSSGTTGVQKYSAHDQCARVSDGAEDAQVPDGAEGEQVSDGAEGAQVMKGDEDMEGVRFLIVPMSTK